MRYWIRSGSSRNDYFEVAKTNSSSAAYVDRDTDDITRVPVSTITEKPSAWREMTAAEIALFEMYEAEQ